MNIELEIAENITEIDRKISEIVNRLQQFNKIRVRFYLYGRKMELENTRKILLNIQKNFR